MQKTSLTLLAALVVSGFGATNASAEGYEKGVMWSGKYSGIANAATSSAHGAEALYFNPAGLPTGNGTAEISGNFSPTLDKFSGQSSDPQANGALATEQINTPTHFSPVYGVLGSYNINPQWAVGIGSYVSAGSKAEFATISPFTDIANPFKTDIYSIEFALGTGYEILPGLKIGVAYRVVMTHAAFAASDVIPGATLSGLSGGQLPAATSSGIATTDVENLSNTRFNGYRLGTQYTSLNKVWGVGVTYRSNIEGGLRGTKTSTIRAQSGGTVVPVTGLTSTTGPDDTSVYTSLPPQISAGANVAIIPTLRAFLQYDWTKYHNDQFLGVDGSAPLMVGWNNESQVRGALEWTGVDDWAFRAGYIWTSEVTPNELALPNLVAPAHGNSITLGAGTQVLNHTLDLDVGLEYSWASGTATGGAGAVTTAAAGTFPSMAAAGDYSTKAYALHLGVTYRI